MIYANGLQEERKNPYVVFGPFYNWSNYSSWPKIAPFLVLHMFCLWLYQIFTVLKMDAVMVMRVVECSEMWKYRKV